MDLSNIREHMDVVGSDGQHVGTIDHVDGSMLKLTKNDPQAGGTHHWIPQDWIASVDDSVKLNKSCSDAQEQWVASPPTESGLGNMSQNQSSAPM
jgi:hypothetical protein